MQPLCEGIPQDHGNPTPRSESWRCTSTSSRVHDGPRHGAGIAGSGPRAGLGGQEGTTPVQLAAARNEPSPTGPGCPGVWQSLRGEEITSLTEAVVEALITSAYTAEDEMRVAAVQGVLQEWFGLCQPVPRTGDHVTDRCKQASPGQAGRRGQRWAAGWTGSLSGAATPAHRGMCRHGEGKEDPLPVPPRPGACCAPHHVKTTAPPGSLPASPLRSGTAGPSPPGSRAQTLTVPPTPSGTGGRGQVISVVAPLNLLFQGSRAQCHAACPRASRSALPGAREERSPDQPPSLLRPSITTCTAPGPCAHPETTAPGGSALSSASLPGLPSVAT